MPAPPVEWAIMMPTLRDTVVDMQGNTTLGDGSGQNVAKAIPS